MPRGGRRSGARAKEANVEAETTRRAVIFHRTKLCKFFAQGTCNKGSRCNFAHEHVGLQPLPDLFRTKLCATLVEKGECKDPECRYAHCREEIRRTSVIRPSGGKDGQARSGRRGGGGVSHPSEPPVTLEQEDGSAVLASLHQTAIDDYVNGTDSPSPNHDEDANGGSPPSKPWPSSKDDWKNLVSTDCSLSPSAKTPSSDLVNSGWDEEWCLTLPAGAVNDRCYSDSQLSKDSGSGARADQGSSDSGEDDSARLSWLGSPTSITIKNTFLEFGVSSPSTTPTAASRKAQSTGRSSVTFSL